jgi:DNA polymerase
MAGSFLGATHIAIPGLRPEDVEDAVAKASASAPAKPVSHKPERPPMQVIPPPESAPAPSPGRPAAPPQPSVQPPRGGHASLVPYVDPPGNPEKEALLAPLRDEAMSCRACELCAGRNSVVWGEGSLDAEVMFIGEGPGRDEDMEGRPFVGRSGKLLTDIIEKGMKIGRNGVYIANVVKCRPPGNRDPKPEEVAACSRYLERQIQVIQPRIIVAVGGVAGCALLNLPPRTPGLRGRWREYRGVPMRVIYHPSYLLRQRRGAGDRTSADRDTWNDIQEVMAKLGWKST